MRILLYVTVLLISIVGCSNGQNSNQHISAEFKFLRDYFAEGEYIADLMTGSENNERRLQLTNKMQLAVENNYAWYLEFVKDAPNGLPVKYDIKLGLTPNEFKEFRSIIDNYRMSSDLEFKINISNENSVLKIKSEYKTDLYEYLEINFDEEQIILGSYLFKLTDTISILDENNRIGSKWKGYQWSYQEPAKIDFGNIAELRNKDAVLYRITFGILEPSKQRYLSIKGVEIQSGVKKVNFTIPIFMQENKE